MGENILIVGLGEVGRPLMDLITPHHHTYGIDIQKPGDIPRCEIMHICFPYVDRAKFISEAKRYIATYTPGLTIINSTIGPGTTREIAEQSGTDVVYSPVRGKHAKMKQDMLHYVKFVGAFSAAAGEKACHHFQSIGMRTKLLSSPEAAELAKLTETTFFGVMIAWAQEIERYCKKYGANYDEVVSFYEEIGFFPPVKYFPGVIGGHCVMPNIKILKQHFHSGILDAVEKSNELKVKNAGSEGWLQ
jgi:UDP-N-acetyl-D-mannosaminuronate dehydrogenase